MNKKCLGGKYSAPTVILFVLILCTTIISENRQEISAYLGGGLSMLNYDSEFGKTKVNTGALGGLGGFGYSHFFTDLLGISTGAEIAMYNSRFSLNDGYTVRFPAIDPEGTDFIFRSTISGYYEKHRSLMLQIPLMIRLRLGGETRQFYFALGGKGAIPIHSRTIGSTANLMNGGFYEKENYEHTQQTQMGFGRQTAKGFEKNMNFNLTGFASAEAGVKFRLNDSYQIFTGIYFDYGLRKIWLRNDKNLVEYNRNNPRDFTMNSVLDSFVSEIRPMAVGLKIGVAFGKGK